MKEYLNAAGVTPYRDCINVTYDPKGAIYEIPNYCINDPYKYDLPDDTTKKAPEMKNITVIIRKGIDEKPISLSNKSTIGVLKENIAKSFPKLPENTPSEKIRLIFGGKELMDKEELWFYNIDEASIIIMMIKAFE
jgi:hypothetical protein